MNGLLDTSMIFDYEVSDSYNAYINSRGIITKDEKFRFEEYAVIKKRVTEAILKYKYLNKIIVVCHGIVMSSMTHFDDLIEHCGTREIEL